MSISQPKAAQLITASAKTSNKYFYQLVRDKAILMTGLKLTSWEYGQFSKFQEFLKKKYRKSITRYEDLEAAVDIWLIDLSPSMKNQKMFDMYNIHIKGQSPTGKIKYGAAAGNKVKKASTATRKVRAPRPPKETNAEKIQRAAAARKQDRKTWEIKVNETWGDTNRTPYGTWSAELAPTKTQGGSRGGAYQTNLAESLQCYFLAAMLREGTTRQRSHFTYDVLLRHAKYVVASSSLNEIYANIGEDWFYSGYESAKTILTNPNIKFNNRLVFYRGARKMSEISIVWKKARDNHNKTKDVMKFQGKEDKWNPSDLYAVDPSFQIRDLDTANLRTLNADMKKAFWDKKIIGVSLKKVHLQKNKGKGRWDILNDTPNPVVKIKKVTIFAKNYRNKWYSSEKSTSIDLTDGARFNEFHFKDANKLVVGAHKSQTNNGGFTAKTDYDLVKQHRITFPDYRYIKDKCNKMIDNPYGKEADEFIKLLKNTQKDSFDEGVIRREMGTCSNTSSEKEYLVNKVYLVYWLEVVLKHKNGENLINDLYQTCNSTSNLSAIHGKCY